MSRIDKTRPEEYVRELESGFPLEGCIMRDSDGSVRPFSEEEKAVLGIGSPSLDAVHLDAKGYKPYGRPESSITLYFE